MTAPLNVTPTVARFVAQSRLERISEPVQDEVVRALLDWLGCCLGGCLDPAVDGASAHGAAAGEEQATLPGRGSRSDLGSAAILSALAADALDFAAVHAPTTVPVSVPVAAALLPLAEARAAAGADVVHAYALGAEITCRLAQALCGPEGVPGGRVHAACGSVGAAAACGRLLGLDASRITHALGIAARSTSGVGAVDTAAQPIGIAAAARAGLAAALLAQRDTANRIHALDGAQDPLVPLGATGAGATLLHGLGEEWQLARVAYKPYPCDSALHAAIEASLGVRARHRPLARQIAAVELCTHPSVLARTCVQAPANAAQARRSLQHAVAVALIDGAAGLEQFDERRVASVRVAEMRSRIEVRGDDALPAEGARIVLHLGDGRIAEHGVRCARGNPARPLSDAELADKFRSLASEVLATDQAERLLALAWNVRALADIGALVRASVPDDALDPVELPGSPLIPR